MKKITLSRTTENLTCIYFVCILFEAICLFSVSTFAFTIPFTIGLILLILSFIKAFKEKIPAKKLLFSVLLIFLILLSGITSEYKLNTSSLLLHIYYLIFFTFINCKISNEKIIKAIKVFIILSTVFAVFGAYQFLAYNFAHSLPLSDLISKSFLTPGYNTFGIARFGSKVFYRAHSIYLEASTFSQLSSICILLTLFVSFKRKNILKKFMIIGINSVGIISSLSGSGIIILGLGLLYVVIKHKRSRVPFFVVILLAIIAFLIINIVNNELVSYYIGRLAELSSKNSSGYYRFVLPFIIGFSEIGRHFFGFGIGNDEYALELYKGLEKSIPNGYGKIFVELGILGLIMFIILLLMLKPSKKEDRCKKILFVIVVIYGVVGGSIVQTSFWCLAIFLITNTPLRFKIAPNLTKRIKTDKVCLVGNNDLFLLPFAKKYTSVLEHNNIDYDFIYWNRNSNPNTYDYKNLFPFNYRFNTYKSKIFKIVGYLKYKHFVLNKLKEKEYTHLIILTSQTMFLFYKYAKKNYPNRYIFDYRDKTLENIKYYKQIMEKSISYSAFTVMSSLGFEALFDESCKNKVLLCHNNKFTTLSPVNIDKKNVLNISFWGMVRHAEYFIKIIDIFKNHNNFMLHFYGEGHTQELINYCNDKNITNVSFYGKYNDTEIPSFASNTDILLNCYPNESVQKLALTCKLYEGISFCLPQIIQKDSYMSDYLQSHKYPHFVIDPAQPKEEIIDSLLSFMASLDKSMLINKSNEMLVIVNSDTEKFEKKLIDVIGGEKNE